MSRRIVSVLAIVVVAAAAALALGAKGGEDDGGGKTYHLYFDNAFGLTKGGDFKVAGVRAGKTTDFKVKDVNGRPLAQVTAEVTEPGLADLHTDAHCEIRPQSLIGEYFIDCQPGTGKRLGDGATLPVERTSSTIAIDLVNDVMRLPYRERLRLIVGELGAGLAGRPEDLSDVLRRAHPALRETSETLQILGRQTSTIKKFVGDARTVVGALENRKKDVSRFVEEAGRTAEITASRRTELGETFHRIPAFLAELNPYMDRLGDLTQAQTPVLRDLQSASGELDTFFTRLRPFANEGTPAFKALGEMSVTGRRAVRKTAEEVKELRKLGKDAPGLAKPLRQFLQTIDDRGRAVEPDRRAAATGPPRGDKTHTTSSRAGFTGMEALWNYFYWQALSSNALDDVGKVLRLSIVVNECSSYQVKPSPALLEKCNSFLGPTQPGVTTPDPTRSGAAAASAASPAPSPSPSATRSREPSAPSLGTRDQQAALDFLLGQ